MRFNELEPLLHGLSDWGERWMARRGIKTREQLKAELETAV